MTKTVAVLGAGISGLSLAYYLKKFRPQDQILVLEKLDRVGGVIDADVQGPLIIDKGPKTIRVSAGGDLLEMIQDLGKEQDLIYADHKAQRRYIYTKQALHKLPASLWELVTSPLTRRSIWALIKECFIKPRSSEDQTIGAFARRHFGAALAETVIEPFVMGICGSSMDSLSLQACFPKLHALELEYGSIIKGMMKTKAPQDKRLFNLKGGFASLTSALKSDLGKSIHLEQNVIELKQQSGKVLIVTDKEEFYVDQVFSTLPLKAMRPLVAKNVQSDPAFDAFGVESLIGVACVFPQGALNIQGFGYLVPAKEQDCILGALFDSCIFPNLDTSQVCKITVLMKPQQDKPESVALEALQRHLGISEEPIMIKAFNYDNALVKYPVGARELLEVWLERVKQSAPWLECCGNYRHPPGVSACVGFSKQLAREYLIR